MASTTKIMTLILALEYGNPDDVVTVSSYAAKMPDVKLGLRAGEDYRLSDLLYSMMLESHNDSACAVAERIGGSVQGFATMMNQKAAEIGLPRRILSHRTDWMQRTRSGYTARQRRIWRS